MLSWLVSAMLTVSAVPPPDTVVVTAPSFLDALRPWIEHRQAQGHRLAIVDRRESSDQVRDEIRRIAGQGGLRYILLVGDVPTDAGQQGGGVPTHQAAAKVNIRFGADPQIATDNWYADLDDDQLPDVSIGRLTADSPAALSQMVAKILAYETSRVGGSWQRQLNVIAGVGGFSPLVDTVIESATQKLLNEQIPAAKGACSGSIWATASGPFWTRCSVPEAVRFRFWEQTIFPSSPVVGGRRSRCSWRATRARLTARATAWPRKCCARRKDLSQYWPARA
jgi:hypothetical protein